MRNGPDGHDTADKRAEALKQRVLKQYDVDKLEALPVSFAGISLQEGEEHGNVVFDKHYGALWNRFEQQNRLKQVAGLFAPMLAINSLSMGLAGTDFAHHRDFAVDRFRFLSPAIATHAALNDIAGTSVARYRHFLSLVDEFHQSWRAHFNPRIVQKATLRAHDYDQFPAFAFLEEPIGAVARRVLVGLLGLLAPTLLIGWLGLRALRRYSVDS